MLTKSYFVYIMTSRENGPIYIGVTSNLGKRTWEHREGTIQGYTNAMHSRSSSTTNRSKTCTKPSLARNV